MEAHSNTDLLNSTNEYWTIVWKTFENASLTYDLAFNQNITKLGSSQSEDVYAFDNPAKLGIFTGLFIAWLADVRIGPFKIDTAVDLKLKTITMWIFNIIFFILLAPLITLLYISCYLYRAIVLQIIKCSEGTDFGGLLEGTDCVWALEDDRAYSVINVLAYLQMKRPINEPNPSEILFDLRNLVNDRLISKNYNKLCWLREEKYGYFYWRKAPTIDLEQTIRFLEYDDEKMLTEDYLRRAINETCNKPLPNDNKSNWEILICKKCTRKDGEIGVPLLFRIHHTVGDGVALLRLLLEAIADSSNCQELNVVVDESSKMVRNESLDEVRAVLQQLHVKTSPEIIFYSRELLEASMPFAVTPFAVKLRRIVEKLGEVVSRWYVVVAGGIKRFLRNFLVLISIPSCLVQQALNSMDKSVLHGAPLTGEKLISCWMESDFVNEDEDDGLLAKIRDIKNSTGTRFGDVLLAALSHNLHSYFNQVGERPPETLSVVIPARMSAPSKQLNLGNRFSVGILPLCISQVNGHKVSCNSEISEQDICENLLDRLADVSRQSEKLRQAPDYLINYWVMTCLSAVLPKTLLRPFLQSHSTMVFSNLPGPSQVEILGNPLKKIAFCIPHRGTTGIGLSFLTYGGRAHFSIISDKAIISNEVALDEILKGTIKNIELLHDYITMKLSHLRKQNSVCSEA